MGMTCNTNGEEECIYVIGKKTERIKPLGRPRHLSVKNIKMDLERDVGVAWTGLIWLKITTDGGLL
jgi:hypothetical protein